MSVYGVTIYGMGVYGAPIAVEEVDILKANQVLIRLVDEIVVDSNFSDPSNYEVTVVEGEGPVRVLRVMVPTNSRVTREIVLVTDYMNVGTRYQVVGASLASRDGVVGYFVQEIVARQTKVDSIFNSIPSHFDKRPESIISNVLCAFGYADEKIGGSGVDV